MPIPEFGRAEVGALKSTSVVNLIFFVESQLKVLLPEPLLCFAAEGCSGQRNVLQDVIVQLAKNAQLSARLHSFAAVSQQGPDPAQRHPGHGAPCTTAPRPPRCRGHGAERRS